MKSTLFLALLGLASPIAAHGGSHHDDGDDDGDKSQQSAHTPDIIPFTSVDGFGDIDFPEFSGCVSVANQFKFACSEYQDMNMSMSATGDYLSACNCYSKTYLATISRCLNQSSKISFDRAQDLISGDCDQFSVHGMEMDASSISTISFPESSYISQESITDNSTVISSPIILSASAVAFNTRAFAATQYSRYTGKLYGGLLLAYFGLILFIGGSLNMIKKAFPKFVQTTGNTSLVKKIRKNIANPALFGYSNATPVKHFGAYYGIPTRSQGLVMAGYFALFIIFSFIKWDLIDDSPALPDLSKGTQLSLYLGIRTGIMASAQLPLIFLFAGRNNIMLYLTGWSYDTFNVYHRFVSRVMYLMTFIHAIAYTVYSVRIDNFSHRMSQPYIRWGIVAMVCASILIATATRTLRRLNYELFLCLHWLFVIIFTVGVWIHISGMKHKAWIAVCVGIWAFDRFMRMCRITLAGLNARATAQVFQCSNSNYDDEKTSSNDVVKLKLDFSDLWMPNPGAYAYLHFLRPILTSWQSHPFTIYPTPNEQGRMTLCIRGCSGRTSSLVKELQSSSLSSYTPVLIDGPYGNRFLIEDSNSIVYLAGGIGITATYSYASRLKYTGEKRSVKFLWCIRSLREMDWFKEELEYLAADNSIEIIIYVTGETAAQVNANRAATQPSEYEKTEACDTSTCTAPSTATNYTIIYGKPDLQETVKTSIAEAHGNSIGFLVCGPDSMSDQMRMYVSDEMDSKNGRVDLYIENFGW